MFRTLTVILAITFMALAYGGAKAQEVIDSEARATATQAQADAALAEQGVSDVSGGLVALQQVVADLQTQIDALQAAIGPGAVSDVSVDCTVETIGDAVALATPGTPLTVTFSGTCMENVLIDVDDITLAGADPLTSIVQGQITVISAGRVVIENATVTQSSSSGVFVTRGASVTLRNVAITSNTGDGVFVNRNSEASIENSFIGTDAAGDVAGNANGNWGVIIADGGHVRLTNVNVGANEDNQEAAIGLFRDTSIRIRGQSLISNAAGGLALDIQHNSTLRMDRPSGTGLKVEGLVRATDLSSLEFRNTVLESDVAATEFVVIRGRVTTLNGNVLLARDSLLSHVGSDNQVFTVNGDVECATSQSGLGFIDLADVTTNGSGLDITGVIDPDCTILPRRTTGDL